MKKFAERLRHLRKEVLKLTLNGFATRVGTSQGYVHELESGRKGNPSPEFLQRISENFGIRREWLEAGDGDPVSHTVKEQPPPRFDYSTDEGCRAAFEWLVDRMPLGQLVGRLNEILKDESQSAERRVEIAKAIIPVIERRKAELDKPE